jgi:hypothetical protein
LDLMNNVMIGLFPSVVDVLLKDCNTAGLAVTTDFDDAIVDVVKCGNGFCDDIDCKDTVKFAAVWINIVGVSWGNTQRCQNDLCKSRRILLWRSLL